MKPVPTNQLLRCTAVIAATITFVAGMTNVAGPLSAQETTQSQGKLSVIVNADLSGWTVREGDQLFAGFLADSNGKPIIYPLIGPGGQRMTRNFPMTDAEPHEKSDHDHQRSLWLTHGEVNGIDFWVDDAPCGKIVQRQGNAVAQSDGSVVIQTENDWNGPDGKRILSDVRRYTLRSVDGRRSIDCDFLLKATDGDVNFGDTKEGSFGVRVAGTMTVDEKLGGVITNAEGQQDQQAWGKKSAWVDYSGPTDGKTAGITIHDHPESFGYPCRWHVRTYGLFAANPFGVHHFDGGDKTAGVTLKQGETLRLSYRVMLHEDGLDPEVAAADSRDYASVPRPKLN